MLALFWILILIGFKIFGSCWFYSDALHEWSFSENFTAALFMISGFYLLKKDSSKWLIALFLIFLGIEETNYFQIFWDNRNLLVDQYQFSLHTQTTLENDLFLMELAVIFLCYLAPIFLWFKYKKIYWQPALILTLNFILIPFGDNVSNWWFSACGLDSTEEIYETTLALITFYYTIKLSKK